MHEWTANEYNILLYSQFRAKSTRRVLHYPDIGHDSIIITDVQSLVEREIENSEKKSDTMAPSVCVCIWISDDDGLMN